MGKDYTPPAKAVDESTGAMAFAIRHEGYRNPVTKEVSQRRVCHVTLRTVDREQVPTAGVWTQDALSAQEEAQLDAILLKLYEAATSGAEFKTT